MDNTYTHGTIENRNIVDEMKESFIDYSMSVITSRALPDVRDGLKPVHRRILYSMYKTNMTPDRPHKKSAHIVGNVLANYHPHGDAAVYDAMVRLAQDFSMRYPLVDGQGNFGNIDGYEAAAQRYTEARMAKLAQEMLRDIEKETVDYMPTYDESSEEPVVLPARFPNLLVNGTSGIAVGMATCRRTICAKSPMGSSPSSTILRSAMKSSATSSKRRISQLAASSWGSAVCAMLT